MQCHDDHQFFFQENLAFGKPTVQHRGAPHGGVSSRAVDGNSATNYLGGESCTHTDWTVNPWWRVDLGQIEPVSEVYIVNQEDRPWWQRQTNFEIRVGRLHNFSINFIVFCEGLIICQYSIQLVLTWVITIGNEPGKVTLQLNFLSVSICNTV